MKYKHNYQIGLEDVDIKGNATNRALMTMMEDICGLHSDSVGYGLDSVEQTGQAWVVLDWKIEIVRRPHYRAILLRIHGQEIIISPVHTGILNCLMRREKSLRGQHHAGF